VYIHSQIEIHNVLNCSYASSVRILQSDVTGTNCDVWFLLHIIL